MKYHTVIVNIPKRINYFHDLTWSHGLTIKIYTYMYILTYINLGRLDTFNKKIKVNSIPLARCILTKVKYGKPVLWKILVHLVINLFVDSCDDNFKNSQREKLFYPIKYKSGVLAASNLFHKFTQSSKFYTFHYYVLRVQMFEKCDSSNRQ